MPSTNKAIFTGLTLEEVDFPALLKCSSAGPMPHCEGSHVWFKRDAILLGEDEATRQIVAGEHPPRQSNSKRAAILP
ncbi:hypothetical protein V1291_003396 [Nitrobacteraceae bacterium AZCC 1564]